MNLTGRLSTACPFCMVAPGEPCMGLRGPRASVHIERWQRKLAKTRKRAAEPVKESNIREALKLRVTAYGGEIRAVAYLGRKHCPDVLCLFPVGSTFDTGCVANVDGIAWNRLHPLVETKRPGKAATEGQAREHDRLRAAGFEVLLITTHSELDAWLPPL